MTRLQQWAYDEIAQTYGVEDVLAKLILLWRMIDNLRNPRWPRENVRDEMRLLVSQQLQKATAAAIYLSELLGVCRTSSRPERTTNRIALTRSSSSSLPLKAWNAIFLRSARSMLFMRNATATTGE
ncbi:hypothetical protein ACFSYD_26890 [Paracoccus aerius]